MGRLILITFDNPVATYYPGDNVTGKVIVKLDAPEMITYISARFNGEANVNWTKSETQTNSDGKFERVDVDYKGHEDYFEATYYLIGSPSQKIRLPPGEHVFNFCTTLPKYLPPSFEGVDGHIRYTLKVKINQSNDSDRDVSANFNVLPHVDLNKDSALKKPASRMAEKKLCCLWCASGPLTVVASVPATGFVCGQYIPVTVEIENGTNKNVKDVICSLSQIVCYTAGTPEKITKTTTDQVKSLNFESVDAHDSKSLIKKMKIPTLPPSKLDYCDIIDIKYQLDVEAVIAGPHINLEFSIPITLGTVPLMRYVSSSVPTPSYDECKHGTGAHGENKFIPRYPTYKLPNIKQ